MTEEKHETASAQTPVAFRALKACVNHRAGTMLPSCGARGAQPLISALEKALADAGVTIPLQKVHCMGRCHLGPTLRLVPSGPYFLGLTAEDAPRLAALLAAGDFDGAIAAFPEPAET